MRSQIKLGRIFGIQIGLHYSWFVIAFLIVISLGSLFRHDNPEWSRALVAALALSAALLFFVSLLLHELSHSVFARSRGLPVREITLFALGGVSQIEKNPTSARTEFWMAFVGPLTSAAIGIVFRILEGLAGSGTSPAGALFAWLGYINLALAGFNLIPGYPLDGGRILRAAIWWKTGEKERSTRIAARVGQVVGGIFIAFGILQAFGGAGIGGLWIAFIGWFLLQAAGESYVQSNLEDTLTGIKVGDIMSHDCTSIDEHMNIQTFVDDFLLRSANRCFLVMDHDQLAGMITAADIKKIERSRWPFSTVSDAMRHLEDMRTITPDTPVQTAIGILAHEDLNQLPVVNHGSVIGLFSRAQFLNFLRTRAELHA
ncbi:MAG TPA: site-2 protease family protein [Bryobacteraceae bacterium]|nr:site-2 protease family protein [Bryobacteraceae bacterium]